jgi:acyl dehydratase
MALDPAFVGRTYPPTEPYEVGREKIREFAAAVGDANPAYVDAEAARALGHPDVIAPPTFPIVLSMRAMEQVVMDPELGLDWSRVVHGDQRFAYARPVRAGDRLTSTVSVESIRSMAGNDMITVRADLATVDGEPVVTARSMLVSRAAETTEAAEAGA